MKPKLISVVMSVYNGGAFLEKSIKSILNQSFQNFELIISNNGSTDNTIDIVNMYRNIDKRVILFDHENLGFSESLNQAIGLATTNIIARMDADDIMLPNRLMDQYTFFVSNKNISLTSCLAYYINDKEEVIGKTHSDIKSIEVNREYMFKNEPIGLLHPGTMYYKDVFIKCGGYRGKFFPAEDIDLWNRFNDYGYWAVVQQKILMKYRVYSDSEIANDFMLSRKKFQWCRECMWLRRSGYDEITWHAFLEKERQLSYIKKINKYRKNYAKYFYRNAGFSFGSNNLLKFAIQLSFAFLLQPDYILKKLYKQTIILNTTKK